MYHSINFGDKNTWDDWHLVPSSRPVFSPPAVKTKTVDIPGGDGVIDLTEALTGYPVYENRTGSFEFVVMNDYCQPIDSADEWQEIYSDIMDYLHGQKMIAVLEDDPTYYYEGRFAVNQWQSGSYYSVITIDYDVEPYKWHLYNSLGEWLSDPFDISSSTSITPTKATTSDGHTLLMHTFERAPLFLTITIETTSGQGMDIVITQIKDSVDTLYSGTLEDGTVELTEVVLVSPKFITITYTCIESEDSGTISVEFRAGRL